MLKEGTIIYFTPFYFKNGNPAKNKYFVILKNVGNKTVVVSLPSSKDYVPTHLEKENGCIECLEANFNCFVFSPQTAITEDGKTFDFPTFLYGHLLDDYLVSELENLYPIEGTDYTIWGKMKTELFFQMIECFKKSKSVKRKYKKIL